jgi:phosphoribosylanthranilate isomerase
VASLADAAGVRVVQLHGDEPPEYCRALKGYPVIKALRVSHNFVPEQAAGCGTQTVLLDAFSTDAYGGTGQTFEWSMALAARALVPRLILAGGLTPENVAAAVARVRPFAVDACSSLERAPGVKDAGRVRAFVAAVRSAGLEDAGHVHGSEGVI